MTDLQVRGYTIATEAAYLREKLGHDAAQHLFDEMSPQTRDILARVKVVDWYPVGVISEINWAIVKSLGKNDTDRARDALIDCGKYMAREASNTFLKLVMKMLTPGIFARKLPDFWRRDCSGGRLTAQITDQKISCTVYDTPGFDHVGAVAAGWVGFALEAMGKSIEKTTVFKWSLTEPNIDGAGFEFTWKA